MAVPSAPRSGAGGRRRWEFGSPRDCTGASRRIESGVPRSYHALREFLRRTAIPPRRNRSVHRGGSVPRRLGTLRPLGAAFPPTLRTNTPLAPQDSPRPNHIARSGTRASASRPPLRQTRPPPGAPPQRGIRVTHRRADLRSPRPPRLSLRAPLASAQLGSQRFAKSAATNYGPR